MGAHLDTEGWSEGLTDNWLWALCPEQELGSEGLWILTTKVVEEKILDSSNPLMQWMTQEQTLLKWTIGTLSQIQN